MDEKTCLLDLLEQIYTTFKKTKNNLVKKHLGHKFTSVDLDVLSAIVDSSKISADGIEQITKINKLYVNSSIKKLQEIKLIDYSYTQNDEDNTTLREFSPTDRGKNSCKNINSTVKWLSNKINNYEDKEASGVFLSALSEVKSRLEDEAKNYN